MGKPYVSDFEKFIDQYKIEHPEVVIEQRRGWSSFWEADVKPGDRENAKGSLAPDDQYGFQNKLHG